MAVQKLVLLSNRDHWQEGGQLELAKALAEKCQVMVSVTRALSTTLTIWQSTRTRVPSSDLPLPCARWPGSAICLHIREIAIAVGGLRN